MTKVTRLGPRNADGVVPLCTDLLSMATNGEILAVAIVYVHADGDIGYTCSNTDHFYKMVGAVEHLKYEMLRGKTDQGD